MKSGITRPKVSIAFGLLFCATLPACTTLKVQSDPPGARVLWSQDGLEPYQSWPPNSWEYKSESTGGSTPFSSRGVYGDTIFVTVEKEGYRRPLPQVAQLHFMRNEKLRFELTELPETRTARMVSEGYVLFEGEWVKPEEKGLAEFNGVWLPREIAERRRNESLGLVEYDGAWLQQEEATRRIATEMAAKGYVQRGDRWMPPEQARREEAVDQLVARVSTAKSFADIPSPKLLGRVETTDAQLELYNSASEPVQFLFSGPISRRIILEPYSGRGARREDPLLMPSGRYSIVVIASELDPEEILALPAEESAAMVKSSLWGSWPFNAGMGYAIKVGTAAEEPPPE